MPAGDTAMQAPGRNDRGICRRQFASNRSGFGDATCAARSAASASAPPAAGRPRRSPATQALLGPVGVLVNSAEPVRARRMARRHPRLVGHAHRAGLRAPFVLMQDFAALPADAEGAVINMLDQRAWSITPHFVSYTVAKAGLWALTQQSMALALAPRIRVNGIRPEPALPNMRQTQEQFDRQSASVQPQPRGDRPRRARHPRSAGDDGPDAGARRPAPAMAARPARPNAARGKPTGNPADRQRCSGCSATCSCATWC